MISDVEEADACRRWLPPPGLVRGLQERAAQAFPAVSLRDLDGWWLRHGELCGDPAMARRRRGVRHYDWADYQRSAGPHRQITPTPSVSAAPSQHPAGPSDRFGRVGQRLSRNVQAPALMPVPLPAGLRCALPGGSGQARDAAAVPAP